MRVKRLADVALIRLVPFDLLLPPIFGDAMLKAIKNRGIKDETGEQIGEQNGYKHQETQHSCGFRPFLGVI